MSELKALALSLAAFSTIGASTANAATPPPPPMGICDTLIVSVYNDCAENWQFSYASQNDCVTANYADGPCSSYWSWSPPNYNYDVVVGNICRFANPTVYGFCP